MRGTPRRARAPATDAVGACPVTSEPRCADVATDPSLLPPAAGGRASGRSPAIDPLVPQHGEDAQGPPLALEPVGLDEASLAAEAEAFEEPVDGDVAVVGLGVDATEPVRLEQHADPRRERLGREPRALVRRCER